MRWERAVQGPRRLRETLGSSCVTGREGRIFLHDPQFLFKLFYLGFDVGGAVERSKFDLD